MNARSAELAEDTRRIRREAEERRELSERAGEEELAEREAIAREQMMEEDEREEARRRARDEDEARAALGDEGVRSRGASNETLKAAGLDRATYKAFTDSEDAVFHSFVNPDGTMKPGWLKAPNGKKSILATAFGTDRAARNLGARAFVQVRTPEFKKWFGDWERLARGTALDGLAEIAVREKWLEYEEGKTSKPVAKKQAVQWFKDTYGKVITTDTAIGKIDIDAKSVLTSLEHGFGQAKFDAVPSLVDGFKNAIYLGSLPDIDGNPIDNHYFAYRINYNGAPMMVYCRARTDANTRRLYLHEVFLESEIKKDSNASSRPAKLLRSEQGQSVAVGRNILRSIYEVKPEDVSKVVDENGEPLVVWHYGMLASEKERANLAEDYEEFSEEDLKKNPFLGNINKHPDSVFSPKENQHFGSKRSAMERRANLVGEDSELAKTAELHSYFLNIRNPAETEDGWLVPNDKHHAFRHEGHDGNRYVNVIEGKGDVSWMAYSPSQVKSAEFNDGTWDHPSDIRSRGNSVAPSGRQKQAGVAYPDASAEIAKIPDGHFAMVRSRGRGEFEAILKKKRLDLQ